jgi:hypothetical protein
MQDIRGVVKSEKQFHKYWAERQKQRERRKEKHETWIKQSLQEARTANNRTREAD